MPIFGRKAKADPDAFVAVCSAGDVVEEGLSTFKIAGRKVILTRYGGHLYAIDTVCPHAAADLSDGSLRAWQLCCHEHDYCFDIRNGRIVWPEDEVYHLRRYEVKEENGQVMVRPIPLPKR